jgi:hypothetical protein
VCDLAALQNLIRINGWLLCILLLAGGGYSFSLSLSMKLLPQSLPLFVDAAVVALLPPLVVLRCCWLSPTNSKTS